MRRFGEAASEFVVKELWKRDLFILPEQTHDRLHESLGLNRYPITRRHYRGAVDEGLARQTRASATREKGADIRSE